MNTREIKFRAWGTTNPKLHPLMFNHEDFIEKEADNALRRKGSLVLPLQEPGLIFMQFTGLLDKSGKEIYEGDIVVKDGYIWFDDGEPNYRGTVEWIYSQWQVRAHCVNSKKRGISDGINKGLNDDGFEDGENSDWEVIGNVWENPELLKSED